MIVDTEADLNLIIDEILKLSKKSGSELNIIREKMLEILKNKYDAPCEYDILNLLDEIKVGYDREIRYRLEKKYYHSITAKNINKLENFKILKRTGLRGKRLNTVFYKKHDAEYDNEFIDTIKKKSFLSSFLNINSSLAGFHAQKLWSYALTDSGFEILAEEAYSFKNLKARANGDIDYIVEKDKIKYGIEIKNSLSYPRELQRKMLICADLNLIPLFIVRWMSKTQFYNIWKDGGLVKMFETSIYPKKYKEQINDCRETLGSPVISLNKITHKPIKHLLKIHSIAIENLDEIRRKNRDYKKRMANYF